MRILASSILLVLAGCVGEAAVSYQGVVVEGTTSGYAFEAERPAGTPLANVVVELCVDGRCGARTETGADGAYTELEQIFGGFLGHDTPIEVRATALDGRSFTYATVFEKTHDPKTAHPSCSDPCPPVFLDFTLAP